MEIIRLILWFGFTVITGYSAITIVTLGRIFFPPASRIALSYITGVGIISLEMTALSWAGIRFSACSLVTGVIPIVLGAVIIARTRRGTVDSASASIAATGFTALEKFLVAAIIFEVTYAFFRALIKPIESYDSVAIYAFNSKIFYLEGRIPANFVNAFKGIVPHPDYPLLVPLAETSLYTFVGSLNDQLVKVIYPLFYLAIIVIFYNAARRIADRRMSLVFAFLVASTPQIKDHAAMGYADLSLTAYFFSGFLCLFLWMRQKEAGLLWLSFFLSALAVWTKAEGFLLCGVNASAMSVYLISADGKGRRASGGAYIIALISLLGAVLALRSLLGLPFHGDFEVRGGLSVGSIPEYFRRVPAILYEYQREFFGPKKWNIIWMIFLFLFFKNLRVAFGRDLRPVTSAILLALALYGGIFLVTPLDLSWHLGSLNRLMLHILPVVAMWIALICREKGIRI